MIQLAFSRKRLSEGAGTVGIVDVMPLVRCLNNTLDLSNSHKTQFRTFEYLL